MWCVADLDAEYLRKMEDVLAVYEKPYRAAEPVVCLDEKPVSLHADLRAPLPARPGQVAKRDNEYKRCGTANVFCAVEPKAGKHFTFPTPDRSAPELARVLNRIIGSYPFARTIHLVMDNLNIHCRKTLTDYFGEECAPASSDPGAAAFRSPPPSPGPRLRRKPSRRSMDSFRGSAAPRNQRLSGVRNEIDLR
jgi:hypothetical protein